MKLAVACRASDIETVRGWILDEYGAEIKATLIRREFVRHRRQAGYASTERWTDGTWRMWLRNRFVSFWGMAGKTGFQAVEFPPVLLHVFSISILETAEQIDRLKFGRDEGHSVKFARSKISTTNRQDVGPVDGTAANVGPPEMKRKGM